MKAEIKNPKPPMTLGPISKQEGPIILNINLLDYYWTITVLLFFRTLRAGLRLRLTGLKALIRHSGPLGPNNSCRLRRLPRFRLPHEGDPILTSCNTYCYTYSYTLARF